MAQFIPNMKKFLEEAKTFINGQMITNVTLSLVQKVSKKLAMATLFSLSESSMDPSTILKLVQLIIETLASQRFPRIKKLSCLQVEKRLAGTTLLQVTGTI